MKSFAVQKQIQSQDSGSAMNFFGISATKKFKFSLPPTKAEQEAIAEALSDADALIESLEQLIAKKQLIKQGAMQELLTGKKRLPGFSGEWAIKQLGDVIEKFIGGGTPSRSNQQYWGDELSWVTVKDFATFDPWISQEMITRLGLKHSASHLIPKGTLITSTRMALGKAVIYKIDVAINQDMKALFPKPVLATQYLYFWFQYHGQSIDELGSGSTVKGISLPDLKKINFQLPSCAEQSAIATILSDMDTEITELDIKLSKARKIKQGMMQALLTGKTRLI
jgi:type I restriction enzyme S subunit